jgi:anthranilate phosphoribosyltransferase
MSHVPMSVSWPEVLSQLMQGRDLSTEQASDIVSTILQGDASSAQIAAFLVALRVKGETAAELQGMLQAVRNASVRVELPADVAARAIDIVGTGGDHSNSVNVSTMSALVVAGAGVPVCKHGNYASSSACGAADVLKELGVAIEIDAEGVVACIEQAGMGFCLASRFHPAFRHAGPTRREIGVPTAFNLLGPMANPAPIENMLVGVANPAMMENMATVLLSRGVKHAWIVHGHGGLDELSLSGDNTVVQLRDGNLTRLTVNAKDFGVASSSIEDIRGGDAAVNAGICRAMLAGEKNAVRDIVSFNAGAALYVAGLASEVAEGIDRALASIDSCAASEVLDQLIEESNTQSNRLSAS